MPEPGAPHTPTVPTRTRPEAEENAMKLRATNDWFRHDGKNVEAPPAGHVRLASKQAHEIAAKYKGESDAWYPTNGQNGNAHQNGNCTTPPKSRTHSAEAQHIREKVAGTEEDWYKHEENQNYVSPQPKSRLTSQVARSLKDSMVRDSADWYTHEGHGTPPAQTGSAKKGKPRTPTPQASENAHRLRPTGLPIWANYSPDKDGVDGSPVRPASRLKTPDAQEYQKRAKGSAADWFSHSSAVDPNPLSPRLATPEAAENASKQRTKVEWFNHDANKNYVEPVKGQRCTSAAAKESREKQRGQLGSHFHQNSNGNDVSPPHHRIKPEAEDYAKKSVQGMMQKFMDQSANQNYQSPRPGPRVRPEGEGFAEKNKGVMDNCMGGGYLDAPLPHNQRRVRPEAEDIANRNKGTADRVMNGQVPPSARPVSRVRPEAQANANRNNSSSLSQMMSSYGQLEISGRPAPRVGSTEAQQNAQKYRGTAADVMYNRA